MSIDWPEVLEKPEKSFKVPGHLLLQQRNKIESLQKNVDELKAAKKESDDKAAALNLRIETVLADLEAEKKKTNEKEQQIGKLKDVVAGLEDNLASSDEKQQQLSARTEELEGIINSKDSELSEQANKITELENKVSELEQAQAKIQELETNLSGLSGVQEQLAAKESEISSLQGQISELEAKISSLESTKGDTETNFEKKIQMLEEEKISFEEQYKLKEAEIHEIIADKDVDIANLQKRIEELVDELKEFKPMPSEPSIGEARAKGSGVQSQIPWKSGTGVFVCPECGSNRTSDVKDKSKVLYVAAGTPIYAKKKRCLNCGTEWSVD